LSWLPNKLRKQAKESPKGEIVLSECSGIELSTNLNKQHCFVLKVPNRDYRIHAESDAQMHAWMAALEKAMPGKTIVKTTTDDLGVSRVMNGGF
jgi:hypothetical protein